MTLSEKITELRNSNIKGKELKESLVGTKVSISVNSEGKTKAIKGNLEISKLMVMLVFS